MIVEHEFNHDIGRVYKTITDPDFLVARSLKLGSLDANCKIDHAGQETKVHLVRERKINVPKVLRAVLKSIQTAISDEAWTKTENGYQCTTGVDIKGAPLRLDGTITLNPTAEGCLYRVDFEPRSKVMFIGRKIEKHAGKTIATEIRLECEHTQEHLDTNSSTA